ncbi:hypothetical protein BM43_3165 [Burkholderia gladioli]|uniref:hypothetical protein n=1 Tax=Burkholderia gladioli TaxID=28095 RepID=UPI0005A8956A|nr:hypothetical protein [Burkholderia gladioli]AJW99616.1 hypothetical protein BM43_3165 [Burkholderia gladioli]ASD79120.1 hypothetical protein CEJ98_08950 [Burkholderia gladioli pv. gladioli]SPV21776.1 Uncharacterised protein [Burkholderia gladioli]
MNLRILKKLSKQAAPLLPLLGDRRKQFPAEKGECYTSTGGHDLKHWERHRVRYPFERDIKYRPASGEYWIVMRPPRHPLKGTVMVGSMEGYYEREWSEETAWESLCRLVCDHFTTWGEHGAVWVGPNLGDPSRMLRAARAIAGDTR